MNYGLVLKRLRLRAGLTQTEVAKKIGYADKGTVWRKESGKIPTRIGDLLLLARMTNVTLYQDHNGEWTF